MSQPDYIDILRIAKSMGIEPSNGTTERDELTMCRMIIQHFDKEFRKMQESLNKVNESMQDIARYRLTWMDADEVIA